MASLNNLTDFKSQYHLQKNMQMLTDTLTRIQNPQGQPLIPNGEGTPMNNLIRELNLQAPAQEPPFEFELDEHVTLDQVQAQCTQRNINLFDVTRNLGNRSFYDHVQTFADAPAAGAPPVNNPWREYSRPEAAEKAVEMSMVTYYGDSHSVVNWTETMPKLKQLFKARVYTNDMAKACLMNMVHKYHPEQAILLRTRTANQIATHLIQLDSNRDKRTYHRMLLFKTVRTPEEDLPAALAKAQLIIDAIYPADDPAYAAHRSSTFRTAIISFCHDTIASGVLELIQKHQAECLPLSDDDIRDFAVKYENYMHLKPTTNLAFGRSINNTPAATFIQLNSMRTAANTIYPAYPAYPSPYANPYPAYPWYDPQNLAAPNGPGQGQPGQDVNIQNQLQLPLQQQIPLAAQIDPIANLQAQIQLQGVPPVGQMLINPAEHLIRPNLAQQPMLPPAAPQPPRWPPHRPAIPLPPPAQVQPQAAQPQQLQALAQALPPAAAAPRAPELPQALADQAQEKQPVQPDQEWLRNLPLEDQELRSPRNDSFYTPDSQSPFSPARNAPYGDQAAWNIPHVPTPKKTMDYHELPTNAKVFVQSQRRLANVGNEVVLVKNHPEDVVPPNLLEQIQALALGTPKKAEKGKKAAKGIFQPTRQSTRDKKPPDLYQAGLYALQASLNAINPTRGYVDSSGRYRSYSRDRVDSRAVSQGSDSRPNSRNDSRTRLSSQDRAKSPNPYYRSQSPSVNRSKSPMYSSDNRQSRTPYKNSFRSSNRSESTRRLYPLMHKGQNCRSDYNPYTTKNCTKCLKNGHHEFECAKYSAYSDSLCSFCHKMNHRSQDCKEVKEFPPRVPTKN